jgi:hypothetical protein
VAALVSLISHDTVTAFMSACAITSLTGSGQTTVVALVLGNADGDGVADGDGDSGVSTGAVSDDASSRVSATVPALAAGNVESDIPAIGTADTNGTTRRRVLAGMAG